MAKKVLGEVQSVYDAVHQHWKSLRDDFTRKSSKKGPKPRKIRKLGWERTKLRNLKAQIDESHNESLSDKQRRTSAHVTRTGDLSIRPSPVNRPRWAVRLSDN
ncbi:hypothetical protein P5673_025043 [Acropora cervicornis]|uniref:Uncharacterized protein n=1 Tax=Acropora cervicornis TaxID=6130 RepID=A0AAD9Q393_ACRCE|nr:hypothetical protein P5673_025043 [Acropora cervicornis]